MLNFKNKSISQVLFVIGYARDVTIRTKQFDIEKAMNPLISGSSINTNLSDDFNPQAARVAITNEKLKVHFTQITAQLTIDIDNTNLQPLQVILESIAKKVNLFQKCLEKIVPNDQLRERGLVLTLNYVSDTGSISDDTAADYIQSNFYKIAPFGKPASAAFNTGYKTQDNFFITLSVTLYKLATGNMPALHEPQWLDLTTLPITESGIELKIDVNSRPLVEQPADVTDIVLNKSFNFVMDEADKFMGITL